jgi:uncharacterized protein YceK
MLMLTGGCATINSRQSGPEKKEGVYPGIRYDAEFFWLCVTGNSVFQTHSSGWVVPFAGYTIIPLLTAVDMPISIVTDTLLLPFDIHQSSEQKQRTKQ